MKDNNEYHNLMLHYKSAIELLYDDYNLKWKPKKQLRYLFVPSRNMACIFFTGMSFSVTCGIT